MVKIGVVETGGTGSTRFEGYGFPRRYHWATCARIGIAGMNGDAGREGKIDELMKRWTRRPLPVRDIDQPFAMPSDISISGRARW
jgi:hypothetical protein